MVEKLPCALEQSDAGGGGGDPLTLSGRYYIGMFPQRGGRTSLNFCNKIETTSHILFECPLAIPSKKSCRFQGVFGAAE